MTEIPLFRLEHNGTRIFEARTTLKALKISLLGAGLLGLGYTTYWAGRQFDQAMAALPYTRPSIETLPPLTKQDEEEIYGRPQWNPRTDWNRRITKK